MILLSILILSICKNIRNLLQWAGRGEEMFVDTDFDITVLKILSVNRLRNSPVGAAVQHANRSRWAIALKREGKTYYTANGRQVLSDRERPVILPKGCSYSWICTEPGECLILEFEAAQTGEDIISFSVADNGFILSAFADIQRNLHIPTAEARLMCLHRVYGLLLQLAKTKTYAPRRRQQLLQPAMEHIGENYFDPTITNDVLAGLCGMSTVYFRKSFEAVYGVSPIRYLHEFRTKKAKDILASDFGSISQVAESVGYASVYHFSKMFKAYTGKSPSQYAKASRP